MLDWSSLVGPASLLGLSFFKAVPLLPVMTAIG